MIVVVDANVIFSALIKEGKSAELLLHMDIQPHTPEFVLEEIRKYRHMIEEKTSRADFNDILMMLLEVITVIPQEDYEIFREEAGRITPDPNDVHYFALALSLQVPIWSNDKELKRQDRVKVYSTQELMGMIG